MPEAARFWITAELTLAELVEVQMRYERRAGTIRRQQWMIVALIPLLVLLMAWRGWTWRHALTPAGWIPLLLVLAFGATTAWRWRRYLTRTRRRILGGMEGVRHEFELTERGIRVASIGREYSYDWGNFEEARLDRGALELWFTPLALVLIPGRIFEPPAEVERWIGELERLTGRAVRRGRGGGR